MNVSFQPGHADNVLVLRLDAPLMSFGGLVVDANHPTLRYPIRSMLGGLLANSLGIDRTEFERLDTVQNAFTFASRWDVEPELLRDYQIADLGGETVKMGRQAWTPSFDLVGRTRGDTGSSKYITQRYYWSNGVLTAVLHFGDATWVPKLVAALRAPARPLFYGRKCCIPAAPALRQTLRADSAAQALLTVSLQAHDLVRRELQGQALGSGGIGVALEADVPYEQRGGMPLIERRTVAARLDVRNRMHRGDDVRATVRMEVPADIRLEALQ